MAVPKLKSLCKAMAGSSSGSAGWQAELAADSSAVNSLLREFLALQVTNARRIDPGYGELVSELANLINRGGKRLRPLLTILAFRGSGGSTPEIYRVAASQELFHAFILMHDDIIDRDTVRWGGPNISGRYRTKLQRLPADERTHFADAFALLGGDICFSLALSTLLSSDFPVGLKQRAATIMHETLFAMVGGETLDVLLSFEKRPPTTAQLLSVARYKTASYSFIMPLQIGALLAGTTPERLTAIENFGRDLGIAFQLRDDLLGMFGNSEQLGKSALSDLREGKQTLLSVSGLRLSDAAGRRLLRSSLGNATVGKAELEQVRAVLETSGARTVCEQLASNYLRRARRRLTTLGFEPATAALLRELADFSISRNA